MAGARTGQSALEFSVLVAVLVAALLTMQIYMKRGFSGRLRATADSIGGAYAPRHTTADLTLSSASKTETTSNLTKVDVDGDGAQEQVMVTKTRILSERTSRTGRETVGSLDSEKLWE